MKKKLILTLLTVAVTTAYPLTNCYSDGGKPAKSSIHREIELALTELRDIKASDPVVGCVAEGDRLTIVVRRHTVTTGVPIDVPGLISCRVAGNSVYYTTEAADIGILDKAKYVAVGVAGGAVTVTVLLIIFRK